MPKYNSIDTIPAKTFFEILKSKDYQLLKPKPKESGLEAIFISIYDAFFLASDNFESKEFLRIGSQIAFLEFKIAKLKQVLHFYFYNQTTEKMRADFKIALFEGYGINLDLSVPFIDEVQRILTIEVGIIQNDLTLLKIDFKSMTDKAGDKIFNYTDAIVSIGNVLQGNQLVREDMTLAMYVSLEKSAKKQVEQQNKKSA